MAVARAFGMPPPAVAELDIKTYNAMLAHVAEVAARQHER